MTETHATSSGNAARLGHSAHRIAESWKPIIVFALFVVTLCLSATLVFQRYKESIKRDKQNELAGIAELKIGQVTTWMDERRSDAQAIKDDALFVSAVDHWLQQAPPNRETEAMLTRRLASLQQAYAAYGYTSISLFDDKAMLRLSSSADETPIHGMEKVRLLESMSTGQITASDVHREKIGAGVRIEIELRAPLTRIKDGKMRSIGAILFRIDPSRFLFPLIQRWPIPSSSAENLLVRRDGDEVVFLNELRHRKNPPLSMRLPLSQALLPAAQAVTGQKGLVEGLDYREVPVVAVLNQVPGTSWFMISKIDKTEIYEPINHLANWILLLMLSLLGAGGGLSVYWQQKQMKQFESKLEHQRLAKHLDYLAKYANDIILLLDSTGKVVEFNDRALAAFGYPAEELAMLNLDRLRALDFSLSPAERFRQIEQAGGALVFESMMVRKNGGAFPIETSVRTINIAGETFYQAIIRDITERKHAEKESVQQRKFIRQVIDSDPSLIFVKDAKGRFMLANEAMAKSFGQTTDGIIGKCNSDFVRDPVQVAAYDRAIQEVLENRRERVALETGDLDEGGKHWFHTIRKPLELGDGSVGVLTIARDVTELKQAEEEQRRLNRALRLLSSCNTVLAHAEVETQLSEVCRLIVEIGGYRMAWVGYAEHDSKKTVRPVMSHGFDEGYLDAAEISWADTERGRGSTGTAIRTGVTQINQNFLTNSQMAPWREEALAHGYQSNISLPLMNESEAFGVLTIYSAEPDFFKADEVELLQELAHNMASVIITQRLRAERTQAVARLRQSEEHFRFLTENATDMVFLMTLPDMSFRYISPACTRLSGYTQEEFYNTPDLVRTILHPDSRTYLAEQTKKLLAGEASPSYEYQIIHKSGESRWMNQRNAPVFSEEGNGTLIAIQGVVTDITERKRAEKELQGQKSFMRQVIDTDPNRIFVKDIKGNFLLANQSAAAAHGLTPDEMVGKNLADINPSTGEVAGYLEADRKVIEKGIEINLIEPYTLPNGERRWLLTIKKPLTMPDGQLSVLGIAVDITEQKLSQMKLAESYKKLQRLSLHLESVRADERARIALNLHDEMGATLVAIKMGIAWLASRLPADAPQLSAEVANITELVSGGIHTMHQIVTQLRPNLLGDVGLAAAIKDYVMKFQQHTNIKCTLVLPENEFALNADQSLTIFRILQESLNNVAKHAQASRVNILFSESKDESLLMVVKDNGIGFDAAMHKEQSFGLLGIRERALMVGGKARISSTRGKGTRVTVNIPQSPSRMDYADLPGA